MVSDFSKKQKGEDNLIIKGLVAGFILLFFVLVVANVRLYNRKKDLTAKIEKYNQEITKIKELNGELKAEIANTGNNEYIEKVAREEINMKKPGESVVSFISSKDKQDQEQAKNKSWFSGFANLWNGLMNIFK